MRTYVGSLAPSERARPSVSQPTQQQLLHLWGSGDTVVAIRLLLPQEPFPKNGLPKNRWIGQNCQNCPAKSYPKIIPKSPPNPVGTLQSAARDSHRLRSDARRMLRVDPARMAQAATKIQAHFRGQRDRAIVEVKKAQAEFRAKSKAERDLLFAMVKQSSLDSLTDVQAMTKVSQHVRRVPRG